MATILDRIAEAEAQLGNDIEEGRLAPALADQRGQLLAALHRLIKGEPRNPELVAMQQDVGRVPVTKDTVALEAGVSRQRFSGPMSTHPIVSELVRFAKPQYGVSEKTVQKLERLADESRVLRQSLRASHSAQAALIIRIEEVERGQKRRDRRDERANPTRQA